MMGIEKWMETSSNKPSLSFGLLNVELLQKWSSLDQAIIDTSSFSIKTYSHTQGLLSFPVGWMSRSFEDFSSSSPRLPPLHSFACAAKNHITKTNSFWNHLFRFLLAIWMKSHYRPTCWMHPVEPVCRGKHLFLLFQQWICAKLLLKQRLQLL